MKTLSLELQAHLAQTTTMLAEAWLVVRTDGQSFGWTAHDTSVTINGVLYRTGEGLSVSAAHTSSDLRVDTIDITAFLDLSTEQEILAGLWDNALVTNFWYNWCLPPGTLTDGDVLIVRHGNLGDITMTEGLFTAQIRGLMQRLNVRIGRLYTPGCPWRHALWNGSTYVSSVECGVTLTSFIQTGTITAVTTGAEDRLFSDTANTQDAGYYNEGLITLTSGDNAGLTREVQSWGNFLFTLKRPFPYAVAVSDAYSAVRGDDKTFSTCLNTFTNAVNFGGFPHIPGIDRVYNNPTGF